jgi:predicted permease
MQLWSRARSTLRNLFRRPAVESRLDEEIRAYVDGLTEEKVAAGMDRDEARRAAQVEAGGVEQVKQAVRDERAGAGLERAWQDVRFGMRQLGRYPGFTLTVVATLALAIGANTAIFSIVNALMLAGLPYAHPERMGTVYTRVVGAVSSDERHHVNGEQWELLRDEVPALVAAVSGIRPSGVNLEAGTHVVFLHAARISAHYLDVLAIRPLLGRNFTEAEDRPHGAKTVILSYGVWRTEFGGDRGVIGRTVLLKGEPYTVIGVLPEGATIPAAGDLYTALQPSREGEGAATNFDLITRLRDGANWQEADAEITRAWSHRSFLYERDGNPGAKVSYYSVPLGKGETEKLRPQALALMLAAGCILLIACANLAGLTLVRVLRRTAEIATRLALGASRWQIQRQLWIENLLLAVGGGAAGVGVGYVLLHGLLRLLPERMLPVDRVPLDGRVLGFTLAALVTRRFDLRSAIGSRAATGGDHLRLRQGLIAGEVALTVVLLAAAGLLVRTLIHLETLPPGFNAEGVMTARASLDDVRYHDAAAFRKLVDESLGAMRAIPGVTHAAMGLSLPYERSLIMGAIAIGDGKHAGEKGAADEVYVSPEYFATLQIPVLAGRAFTDGDGPQAERVVIVNRSFARKYFHDESPVGRHVLEGARIVGVVEDVAMAPGIDPAAPLVGEQTMYVPAAQMESQQLAVVHVWFQPSWMVRTAAPVEGLTAAMQRALTNADPGLPFAGFYSLHDVMMKTLAAERVEVALLGALAALALLMSALGIFALVANIVAQRTREIGIRVALGSTLRQAMLHAGWPGLRASGLGLAAGLALCALVLRAMRSVLYGVGVYDARALAGAVLILMGVAVAATVIPTLRIARIDPARTLREE